MFLKKKSEKEERHKRCCFHFKMRDIAAACNISVRTLQRICNKNNIFLRGFSLSELVDFIINNRKTIKDKK